MACEGTRGRKESRTTTSTDLRAVSRWARPSTRSAAATPPTADAEASSKVERVELGRDDIVLRGLVARVDVHRGKHGRVTSTGAGTTPGAITVGNHTRALPARGTYLVPGVARITTGIESRTSRGRRVTAARIDLLDGTLAGSTLSIGTAFARIDHR